MFSACIPVERPASEGLLVMQKLARVMLVVMLCASTSLAQNQAVEPGLLDQNQAVVATCPAQPGVLALIQAGVAKVAQDLRPAFDRPLSPLHSLALD